MPENTVYTSRVRIERIQGPNRRAFLPAEAAPTLFGVHSEIAEHYGVDPAAFEPHATTLDYVVAAAGGWLTGTFGGALEARGIQLGEGDLIGEVRGDVGADGKVLMIRRIHVTYRLKISPEQRETAERVHGFHAEFCPVARSIAGCIEIATELETEERGG